MCTPKKCSNEKRVRNAVKKRRAKCGRKKKKALKKHVMMKEIKKEGKKVPKKKRTHKTEADGKRVCF